MAFTAIDISSDEWTLISSDEVSNISFQNVGSKFLYINFTAGNTAPNDDVGLLYSPLERQSIAAINTLWSGNTAYVWAKSASGNTTIIIDQ